MKLLVLGGTHFVGLHFVREALARGHQVTLFNRGRSNRSALPEAERITGDRDGAMSELAGRSWDAVFDPSAFYPETIERTCAVLDGRVDHYTFISSAAAYSVPTGVPLPLTETSVLEELDTDERSLHREGQYGALKVACERSLSERFAGTVLTIRPGLVGGPDDLTDRLTYWPRRISIGGEVLAPGPPNRRIQILDVRDLAAWMLTLIEGGASGAYNAAGQALTLEAVLHACNEVSGSDATVSWVDERFLREQGVTPWTELPLWMPAPASLRVSDLSTERATKGGLVPRPIAETLYDTLVWDRARPRPLPRGPVGTRYVVETMLPDREEALLSLWHTRSVARSSEAEAPLPRGDVPRSPENRRA